MGVLRRLRMTTVVAAIACLAVSCGRKDPAVAKVEHLNRGDAFAKEKKYHEAVVEYRSALAVDPKYGKAFVGLGESYAQLGDTRNSMGSYARAADLLPDDVDVLVKTGTMHLLLREYVDAQTRAEQALARDPRNLVALILRANALAGLMEVDKAIQEIQDAIQLEPGRAELYANLGSIQANRGKDAEAEAAFKQAVTVDPKSPRAYAALGNFYWSVKRSKDAEQAFLKAVELEPTDLMSNKILATFYVANDRVAESEKFLKVVADLSGDLDDRLRQADFLVLHGQIDDGIAVLKTVAEKPEGFGPATTRIAGAEYSQGHVQEGHRLLDEVLKQNANDAGALLLQAHFHLLENRPADAVASAQQAVRANPKGTAARYFLGQLYERQGDKKAAILEFQTVVQLNPRAAAAQLELSKLSLASGNAEAAVKYADVASMSDRNNLQIRLALVRALLEKGDLTRAEKELATLERDFKGLPEIASLKGNLYLRRRDIPAARRVLEDAYKRDPTSIDALSGLIAADLATNQPAQARARIETALSKAPTQPRLLVLAARTYAAQGNLEKAEAALMKVLTVDPANLDSYSLLGQLYVQEGKLDDGRAQFEAMAKRDPKNIGAQTMVGIILKKQGRVDDAVRQYEQLVTAQPEAAVAANNLAWIYADEGRNLDRAIALAQAAKLIMPNDPGIADTLGWTYYRKDLPLMAVPYLREGVQKSPGDPVFHYHLGAAYAKAKDAPQAIAELETALRLSATFAGAEDAKKLLSQLRK